MRTWIISGLILLALVLAGFSFSSFSSGVLVDAGLVRTDDIEEYIDEEGKTRLAEDYLVTMPYSGRLEAIELKEGTTVSQGEVVARMVPLDQELNVAAAKAAIERLEASVRESKDVTVESTSLEQAINFVESMNRTVEAAVNRVKASFAKLDYANKSLSRIERLFKQSKSKSEDELDQARVTQVQGSVDYQQDVLIQRAMESMQAATALMPTAMRQYIKRKDLSSDVLEKQLAEAEIALKQAEKEQNRGTMTSPIDGVVLERKVSNEQQLAAGAVLLRLGRWEDLEVEADVLSQEVVRVKQGDRVEILGPAIGNPPAKGTVDRVYPAGFTKVSSLGVEQQRVKVIMKIDADDLRRLREERNLGDEYRVRVRITTARKSHALVVPRSALFRRANGDWRVFVVRGGRAELAPVKIGLGNDERAEVLDSLREGDQVILSPESNLTEGQAVRVVKRE